jgi:very-short-patch-repair endonuclease
VRLVVELDGEDNHSSRGQVRRDRRKEMDIRAAGFRVVRYSAEQVFERPGEVIVDVRRLREDAS